MITVTANGNRLKFVGASDLANATRRDRLQHVCTQEHFTITNTHFDKQWNQLWTHHSKKAGGVDCFRQIDFIMVDAKHKWRVQYAYASDGLCVGDDHRTVNAVLDLKKTKNNNKRATTEVATRHNFKSWQPQNGKE